VVAPSWEGRDLVECPSCRAALTILVFPALSRDRPVSESGERALDGDAACFFHAEKKASVVCDRCGRYICALCDLPVGSRHVCPSCLDSGLEQQERMPELISRRLCWGQLSFLLGVLPPFILWVMFPLLMVSGGGAVYCGLYGWNKPGSLVKGPQRVLASFGILFGLLQIIGVIAIGLLAWKGITSGNKH
jgi:hypothetical protein